MAERGTSLGHRARRVGPNTSRRRVAPQIGRLSALCSRERAPVWATERRGSLKCFTAQTSRTATWNTFKDSRRSVAQREHLSRPPVDESRPLYLRGGGSLSFWSPAARFFASSSPGQRRTGPGRAPARPPRRDLSVEPSAAPGRRCVAEIRPFFRPKRADLQARRTLRAAPGVRGPPRRLEGVRGPPVGPLLPSGWNQFAGERARKKDGGQGGRLPSTRTSS